MEDTLIETIVKYMELAEKMINKSGASKKSYVLDGMKDYLGEEEYDEKINFILSFIDFTINLSRGDVLLHLNKIKKKYCCF
jgi:hypothetical protein